jgi:hypothetical protein
VLLNGGGGQAPIPRIRLDDDIIYREFVFDMNEAGGSEVFLSLDQV